MIELTYMERSVKIVANEYYHVYNRGVAKQAIFKDQKDYTHFQRLLFTRNTSKRIDSARVKGVSLHKIDRGDPFVDIIAYALMPNHFHLLLTSSTDSGISHFMNKLGTAYAMYFNTKYERSGPLMCRPFRSKHITDDDYLRWVISYIHLNPSELTGQNISSYPYSSYQDYFGDTREENLILNQKQLPINISDLESLAAMKSVIEQNDF